MRERFALGSALQLKGRTFQGLSGFEGKPFHPPLTDVPIGAYVIGPILDVIGFIGRGRSWGHEVFVAAGYTIVVGAAFSLLTLLTGFTDWLRMRAGSEVRRITNSHALLMLTVTILVCADLAVRYLGDAETTSGIVVALGLVIVAVMTVGAMIGGSLVFDKGYKVRARMKPPSTADGSPAGRGAEG